METKEQTLQVLRGMRETLSDPKAWTQGVFAGKRGEDGAVESMVHHGDPTLPLWAREGTTCWCMVGAGLKAGGYASWHTHLWEAALERVVNDFGERSVPSFNDNPRTTHDQVLTVIDKAIADVEAQQE